MTITPDNPKLTELLGKRTHRSIGADAMLMEVLKDVGARRVCQPEGLKGLPHGGQSNVHVVHVRRAQVVHLQLAGTIGHRRGQGANESVAKSVQLLGAESSVEGGAFQRNARDRPASPASTVASQQGRCTRYSPGASRGQRCGQCRPRRTD
eukprot:1675486-Amphidinium_carterae.3